MLWLEKQQQMMQLVLCISAWIYQLSNTSFGSDWTSVIIPQFLVWSLNKMFTTCFPWLRREKSSFCLYQYFQCDLEHFLPWSSLFLWNEGNVYRLLYRALWDMDEEHCRRSRLYAVIKGRIAFLWVLVCFYSYFFQKIFTGLLIEKALETHEPNRIENHRNRKHW